MYVYKIRVLPGRGCGGRATNGCRPDGVSDNTWKWDVGGGPIAVGRDSVSICYQNHQITICLFSQEAAYYFCS
jgi:hypothetical protein